jgi:uncharacterized membrane protein
MISADVFAAIFSAPRDCPAAFARGFAHYAPLCYASEPRLSGNWFARIPQQESRQMISLHAGSAITAAFLASLVEAVEALTIVLAVAIVRGWRPAGLGAVAGLAVQALIVVALGPLLDRVPLNMLQIAIGVLLLLFGMRWLRKAILRAAGIIALHDETTAFASETAELREQAQRHEQRLDWLAGLASFKAVLLEGLEVVFIVIAVSAGRGVLLPVSAAAFAACLLVALSGILIHRPLARVPENALKFAVGVMLSAFGLFWTGEGFGVAWPGADLAILAFIAMFLGSGLACVALLKGRVVTSGAS